MPRIFVGYSVPSEERLAIRSFLASQFARGSVDEII